MQITNNKCDFQKVHRILQAFFLCFVVFMFVSASVPAGAEFVPSGSVSPFVWSPLNEKWENGNPKGYREGEIAAMVLQIRNEEGMTYQADICLQVMEDPNYYAFSGFGRWDKDYQPGFFPPNPPNQGPAIDYSNPGWDTSKQFIWGYNITINSVSAFTLAQGECAPDYLGASIDFTVNGNNAFIVYGGRLAAPGDILPVGTPDETVPIGQSAANISGTFQSRIAGGGAQTINFKGGDIEPFPKLSLTKTVTTADGACPGLEEITVPAGTELRYCFDIFNSGNITLNNVTLDDPLLGGDLTGDLEGLINGSLPSGVSARAEILYQAGNTTVINTATTTSGDLEDKDSCTIIVYNVDIDASKKVATNIDGPWVDGPINILKDASLFWQITVINNSDAPVNLTLTDELDGIPLGMGNEFCTDLPAELAAAGDPSGNDSYTCIIQDTAKEGVHTNKIIATGCDKTYTEICDRVQDSASYFGADTSIAIRKTPDTQQVVAGQDATFTIRVENTGNVELINVTVDDPVAPDCKREFESLSAGAFEEYTCTVTVNGDLTNTAEATGTPPVGGDVMATDTAEVDAITPSIAIRKTPDTQQVVAGQAATFTIRVENTGDVELTNVTVDDPVAPNCEREFASLLAGASEEYTCTVTVNGDLTNTAEATGTPPVGGDVMATDTAEVDAITPSIAIRKTPDTQQVITGHDATFTIRVENTGDVELVNVTVDDPVAPDCEREFASLAAGAFEEYTCTVTVNEDLTNTAEVTGTPPVGGDVMATDAAEVDAITPSIAIRKTPDTQQVITGHDATFTIRVENTGDVELINVTVDDPVAPNCKREFASLLAGAFEEYTCTVTVNGDLTNKAEATGTPPVGGDVMATDTAQVDAITPAIDIEKSTNGFDADDPPGPTILEGSPVLWDYVVTNIGDVSLENIKVTDDRIGLICTISSLPAGESTSCSKSGDVIAGQYGNYGTASVTYTDDSGNSIEVNDSDPSHYFGMKPEIRIDKQVSGDGINWSDSVKVIVGSEIWYRFIIKNTGNLPLENITLEDDLLQEYIENNPDCTPPSTLTVGEVWDGCIIGPVKVMFTGENSPSENTAVTQGSYEGYTVTDSDTATYYGLYWALTPGFWKNHTPWYYTAFKPGNLLADVFEIPSCGNTLAELNDASLLDALGFGGGSGTLGAAKILFRAAVASLLNASYHEKAHSDIFGPGTLVYFPYYSTYKQCMLRHNNEDFCYENKNIVDLVNSALASCNRQVILDLACHLDLINNGLGDYVVPACRADFDNDKDVDGSDLAVFAADFGRTDCEAGPLCEGDFDKDNDVDGSDLAIFASEFGRVDCP